MAKFLTGEDLSKKIYDIIWEAEEMLLIVSPYIKLDEYFKTIFEKHKFSHKLHITIVYGKNESQPSKSLRREDFEFFKQFKNISIIFCPPLHAKYYANDGEGILTSINLYDHSFKNNIEYGVYFPSKLSNIISASAEEKALSYTLEMVEQHPAVFIKRPVYEKKLFGKNYIESTVLYDATDKIINFYKWNNEPKKHIQDFPDEINANEYKERPERVVEVVQSKTPQNNKTPLYNKPLEVNNGLGFCIRTGVKIPFNPEKPLSAEGYKTWIKYGDPNYGEQYCHFSGEPSKGETSVSKPILRKNWSKAKELK